MVREVVEVLETIPAGVFLDATVGAGGHTAALLDRRGDLTCVGLDRDPQALALAARRLPPQVSLLRQRFDRLGEALDGLGIARLSGVLFDLGVSSMQLDTPERGFSFRHAGPIDMRMDPDSEPSAGEIVNTWPVERLARLLASHGDEPHAGRIARAIVARRPLGDTAELAEVIASAVPARHRRRSGHPARRSFQALRIAVNDELEQIRPALAEAIERLSADGRCVVLSYHSGEDRIVKDTLAGAAGGGCRCPPRLPCACGATPQARLLWRGIRRPLPDEVERNPRAAAARMRAIQKLPGGAS